MKPTFVAIDLETTGKYPLTAKICEVALIKYSEGKIIDSYSSLINPQHEIPAEVIKIHGITNDDVINEPTIESEISRIYEFLKGSYAVAHHAPFDMSYLAIEFEKAQLPLSDKTMHGSFCTSVLSQAINTGFNRHRLKDLVAHYNCTLENAHRAYDDAKACLDVFINMTKGLEFSDLLNIHNGVLNWVDFSINELSGEIPNLNKVISSISNKQVCKIIYHGGSKPGIEREVLPIGIIRNPKNEYDSLVAHDFKKGKISKFPKKYALDKVEIN